MHEITIVKLPNTSQMNTVFTGICKHIGCYIHGMHELLNVDITKELPVTVLQYAKCIVHIPEHTELHNSVC